LEKALKRGVSEFARGEIKTRLRDRLKKREDTRFMMLRYAAVLLVAVITPLILYYQFNVAPEEMATSVAEAEKKKLRQETKVAHEEAEQSAASEDIDLKTKQPPFTARKAKEKVTPAEEKKPVQPATPAAGARRIEPERTILIQEKEEQKIAQDQGEEEISPEDVITESSSLQDMLSAVESTPTPKLEADHPPAQQSSAEKTKNGRAALRTTSLYAPIAEKDSELNKNVTEDSLAIRNCIDKFLNESDRDKYKIHLNIQVLKGGKIGEIEIIHTSHQSAELENCLFNIIKGWIFSKDVNDRQVLQEIKY
jgi:hypothetical protein